MKTLADFPQFTIESVTPRRDGSSQVTGIFNRIDGVGRESWDYLISDDPFGVPAFVVSFDDSALRVSYKISPLDTKQTNLHAGQVLAWLSSYWNPQLIYAVRQGPKAWRSLIFHATTAYARANGSQWTNSESLAKESAGADQIVTAIPGGWDHEHCELCKKHIDAEDQYWFSDNDKLFLCTRCYENVVLTGDLSEFIR